MKFVVIVKDFWCIVIVISVVIPTKTDINILIALVRPVFDKSQKIQVMLNRTIAS